MLRNSTTGTQPQVFYSQIPSPYLGLILLATANEGSATHRRRPPPQSPFRRSDVTPPRRRSCHPQIQGSDPIKGAGMANSEKLCLEQRQRQEKYGEANGESHIKKSNTTSQFLVDPKQVSTHPSLAVNDYMGLLDGGAYQEKKSSHHATVKDSLALAKVSYGTNSFANISGDAYQKKKISGDSKRQ